MNNTVQMSWDKLASLIADLKEENGKLVSEVSALKEELARTKRKAKENEDRLLAIVARISGTDFIVPDGRIE